MDEDKKSEIVLQGQADLFGSAQNFELAQRVAKGLASSSLVPDAYKGNVANTILAMEIAHRIGASVFAVMQHLYIVYGKPAFDSTFLIATVNSSNRFTPLKFRFSGKEGEDDWGCRAVAKDKETGDECIGPCVTIGLAKKEGWYDKKGSKWQTMPELMLHYRAAAFWVRIYAPELSLGMQTADETVDSTPMINVTPQETRGGLEGLKVKLQTERSQWEDLAKIKEISIPDHDNISIPPNDPPATQQFSSIDLLKSSISDEELDKLCETYGFDASNLKPEHADCLLNILHEKERV